jgi:hypothetical protein
MWWGIFFLHSGILGWILESKPGLKLCWICLRCRFQAATWILYCLAPWAWSWERRRHGGAIHRSNTFRRRCLMLLSGEGTAAFAGTPDNLRGYLGTWHGYQLLTWKLGQHATAEHWWSPHTPNYWQRLLMTYSLCPKLSVAFDFRAAILIRFVENVCNICIFK